MADNKTLGSPNAPEQPDTLDTVDYQKLLAELEIKLDEVTAQLNATIVEKDALEERYNKLKPAAKVVKEKTATLYWLHPELPADGSRPTAYGFYLTPYKSYYKASIPVSRVEDMLTRDKPFVKELPKEEEDK